MKLDANIAREAEKTLGRPLPRPDDEAFGVLLKRLEREQPELAETLRSGLIHEELGDIESEAHKHGEREKRLRRLRRTALMRYDELEGEWHLSKLKVLSWGSVVGLGVMAIMFLGAPLLSGGQVGAKGEAGVVEIGPDEETPVVQDSDPFAGLPEELEQNERMAQTFTGAQPVPTSQPPAAVQDPASGEGEDDPAPAPLEETPPLEAGPLPGESPLLPATGEEEDPGLGVYRAAAGSEEGATGLKVYGEGATNPPDGADDPFAEPEPSQGGPVGLAAYRHAGSDEEVPTGLMAFRAEATPEPEGVRLYQQVPAEPGTARQDPFGGEAPRKAPPEGPRRPDPAEVAQLGALGVALAQGEAPQAPDQPAPRNPYTVGDSIPATLQVGVVAVDGTPLPVLARGDDGSVWQGDATLTPTGRVDIRFTTVLKGRQHAVSAVAQAGDGYLGLPAEVTETTPALASDLARGALRGLSEYAQALGQQTEVRVEGNTPVISRNAPPLEASVAGSVARLFTPLEGEDQQALVRLAQVPAETRIKIVILASSPPPGDDGN